MYVHMCLCHVYVVVLWDQRRVWNPLELELQEAVKPHRCWEPSAGPLEEQRVLQTAEPSPQHLSENLKKIHGSIDIICAR